jgi:chromosome segregation ATPase
MDDLEIGIGRLKKSSREQQMIIDELKKERSFLIKKNDAIDGSIRNLQNQINPNRSDINELKKELVEAIGLITDIKAKDARFQSVLTEQKSNLFLLKSRFEKNLDKVFDDIDIRIKENKRIELTRFNEIKSKIDKLMGVEDRLRDHDDAQKSVIEKLTNDLSKLQQTVAGITSKKLSTELEKLNKHITSETKSLVKQIAGTSEVILNIKDRVQYLEPALKEMSEKLESQAKSLNKTIESKEFLLKRSDAIGEEIKFLKEKISSERERISVLEKDSDVRKKEEDRTNKYLESAFQQAIESKSKELEANVSTRYRSLEEDLKLLTREISLKKDRVVVLEEELKNQSGDQKSQLRNMAGLEKVLKGIEKRVSNSETMISHTGDSIRDIESRFQQLMQGKSRDLKTGIETRCDKLEKEISSLNKNLSSEMQRIVAVEKDNESARVHIEDSLNRIGLSLRKDIEERSRLLESGLKSLTKDLATERERISVLEKDSDVRKKEDDNANKYLESSFQQAIESKSKEINTDIKSLTKDLALERERMRTLESEFREQVKNQESKTKEVSDSVSRIHINEAKREEGFSNTMGRLQELQIRTEESLKSLDDRIKQISKIESNLEKKFHNENEKIFKRLGSSYDSLDEKLNDKMSVSNNSISRLEESMRGLGKNLEDHLKLINEAEKKMFALENDIVEHSRSHDSYNRDFDGVLKTIDDLEERASTSEKMISRLDGLMSRMSTLEDDRKKIDIIDKRVLESENQITHLGDSLKKLESVFDKSMTTNTDELESGIKSLTMDLAAERKRILIMEQELKNQSVNQKSGSKDMKSIADDILDLKSRISDSEKLISHISEATTSLRTRIMDEDGIAKKFGEQSKLIDKVTNAGERFTRIEEKLSSQSKDHDLRFNEMISVIKELEMGETKRIKEFNDFVDRFQKLRMKTEHNLGIFNQSVRKMSDVKGEIKSEVSKDLANNLKDLKMEFGGVNKRVNATEELLIQLNDSLDKLKVNIGGLGGMSKSMDTGLKNLADKISTEKEKRIFLEQKLNAYEKGRDILFANINNLIRDMEVGEAKRIKEYNKFIQKFQDMKMKADQTIESVKSESGMLNKMSASFDVREARINEMVNLLKEDVNNRIQMNEGMYDSEMDDFKKKMDVMTRELMSCKKMQQDFYEIIEGVINDGSVHEIKGQGLMGRSGGSVEMRKPIVFDDSESSRSVDVDNQETAIVTKSPEAPRISKQKSRKPIVKKPVKFSSMLDD